MPLKVIYALYDTENNSDFPSVKYDIAQNCLGVGLSPAANELRHIEILSLTNQ